MKQLLWVSTCKHTLSTDVFFYFFAWALVLLLVASCYVRTDGLQPKIAMASTEHSVRFIERRTGRLRTWTKGMSNEDEPSYVIKLWLARILEKQRSDSEPKQKLSQV